MGYGSFPSDPTIVISWFVNPTLGGSIGTGYLNPVGSFPLNPYTEKRVFACAMSLDGPKRFDTETRKTRIRNSLDLPDLTFDLHSLSHLYINDIVTNQFRSPGGRVFLVGDAAHRIPPWGALRFEQ